MSYQQQHLADSNNDKRTCKICQDNGFPGQEVIKLSTYGGRDANKVNLDGSKHYHLFSLKKWDWNHYDVSKVQLFKR